MAKRVGGLRLGSSWGVRLVALAIALCLGLSLLPRRRGLRWSKISVRPSALLRPGASQDFVALPAPPRAAGRMPGLVFDIGFNNGADTRLYLQHLYDVVAVEANPLLVKKGEATFAGAVAAGRLQLLSVGIAAAATGGGGNGSGGPPIASTLPFYVHKELDIWSSFEKAEGCRIGGGKDPTPSELPCYVVEVPIMPCLDLFLKYGVPWLLKLDIESDKLQESCLTALQRIPAARRPRYVVDAEHDHILTLMGLGYTRFKLVCQDDSGSRDDWGHSSGPFGEFSVDAERGWKWRVFNESDPNADATGFAAELLRARESCGGDWWDIHAATPVGRAA